MTDPTPAQTRLVAAPPDDLCLAFANTRYRRGREVATETLHGPADLIAWSEREGVLDQKSAKELTGWAVRNQDAAMRLFDETIAAREALYALFDARSAGRAVADRDMAVLN